MRIAIDVRSLMEGRLSGVEEYTTQIIRALVRVAPHHEYKLFYNSARSVRLPEFSGNVEICDFRYPNKFFNTAQWALGLPRWDKLVPADVYFVPNSRLMPLSGEAPLVVTAHDLSFEQFPEFLDARRRLWHSLMGPRQLMQRADAVIAVSEHTKRDVVRLYNVEAEKISVVYSGIEKKNVSTSEVARVRELYRLPRRFVLFLGTMEPRKNISSLLKAFEATADSVSQDLVIAGERGWKEQVPLMDRVHRLGVVPEGDKAALMAAADLFVYPSFYEGFGFPPLEALLAGTPVIASFNSALPEVVGPWATLIDPHNPAELALVMKELLHDLPVVTKDMQKEILGKYNWDNAARETLVVLESVV